MHELGIARDLWAVIRQQAEANGIARITAIRIVVGEASGIEADFLEHSLRDHVFPGSIAEGAGVEFVREKLAARCNGCDAAIAAQDMLTLACPSCGGQDIDIVAGKETYVQGIEGE